jgi:DNA polymerase (family 10)
MNEYGIFDAQTGKRMAGETEEEMYHFLNLRYIPPEMRLGEGEIEAAELTR